MLPGLFTSYRKYWCGFGCKLKGIGDPKELLTLFSLSVGGGQDVGFVYLKKQTTPKNQLAFFVVYKLDYIHSKSLVQKLVW